MLLLFEKEKWDMFKFWMQQLTQHTRLGNAKLSHNDQGNYNKRSIN